MFDALQQRIDSSFGPMAHYMNATAGLHLSSVQAMLYSGIAVVFLLFFVILALFFRRGKVSEGKAPGTTGREATKHEIIKHFAIPSKGSVYFRSIPRIFLAMAGLAVVVAVCTDFTLMFLMTLSAVGSLAVGFLYVGTGNMHVNLKLGNYFQFGEWHGRRVGLIKKQRQENIAVIGPTGAGKTAAALIPNIINDAKGNCSCVVIDRKSDENIADIVGSYWQAEGKPVIYFDPYNEGPAGDLSINPLLMIEPDFDKQETFDAIEEIIDMLFKAYAAKVGEGSADTDHYKGREERLLKCILMAVLKMPTNCRHLPMVLEAVEMPPDDLNRFIAGTKDKRIIAKYCFFVQASAQERNNSLQGLYRKLQLIDSPTLKKTLYRNDVELDMIFKEPSLFIIKAELLRADMGFITSLLMRLIMRRHLYYANPDKCKGFKKKPTWYYLDEFAQLNIPEMHNLATTIRSSDGGLIILTQELDDFATYMKKVKSGSSEAAFGSSMRTKMILPGCNPETCQDISKMLGEVSFKTYRRTKSFFGLVPAVFQEQAGKAPLITADDIQYMDEDKALILSGAKRPFFVKQMPYYKDPHIVGIKGYLAYKKADLMGERVNLSQPVDFYKPAKKEDFKIVRLSEIMQLRNADIEEFMPLMDKIRTDTRITAALESEDRKTPETERISRIAKLMEDKGKEEDGNGGDGATPKTL